MASTSLNEMRFDQIAAEATAIRRKLEGGMYYGIPISKYPNQADVHLAIAYNLRFMEDLAVRVEIPKEQEYPSFMDAGGEY